MTWPIFNAYGCDESLLDQEIAVVFPALTGLIRDGSRITLVYSAEPDQATKDAVAAVVAAHDPTVLELRLNDHVGAKVLDHRQIDYRTGLLDRIHRYVDFNDPTWWKRGEYRRVEYYETPKREKLVLRVEIEYVRHADGLLNRVNDSAVWGDPDFIGRRTVRTWFRKNGEAHPDTKITVKTYDVVEAAAEGVRRRQGVYDRLKVVIYGLILQLGGTAAEALAYVGKHQNNLLNYVETGDNSFRTTGTPNLSTDTEPWLDVDIGGGITPRLILLDSTADLLDP